MNLRKANILIIICIALAASSLFSCEGSKLNEKGDVSLTIGSSTYREFTVDNVYHSKDNGDIHFHSYFPKDYDGKKTYALFISLPGYQGLYFQGVGANIRTEDFVFEAQKYNDKMIIIAPQLREAPKTPTAKILIRVF